MALELYANQASTTVTSGGTDAPSSGTQETWAVASSAAFPAASSSSTPPAQFHVADAAQAASPELIAVTDVSGDTWTVTRGAESTTPVEHDAGFTIYQVVSAGGLTQQTPYAGKTILVAGSGSSTRAQRAADYLCTGTNDDLVINEALAALGSAPGGAVLLAEGEYYEGGTGIQILGGNQHLYGLGDRAGVVISLGASAPFGVQVGTSGTGNLFNNSVRHLTIDGTGGMSTADAIIASSNMFKAEDLYLSAIPQDGISLSSFISTEFAFQKIIDVNIYQPGRDGVVTDTNIYDMECLGVTVSGTYDTTPGGRYGFNINGSYIRLIGCRANDMANGWGVYAASAFLLQIIGGHFDENGQTAAGGGIRLSGAGRMNVTGCAFNSNDSYDVYVTGASNFSVVGGQHTSNTTKGPKLAGIYVTGSAGGVVADNNLVDYYLTSTRAIVAASSSNVDIHDNLITNPGTSPAQASIRLYASSDCMVHHNQVAGGISEENTSNSNLIEQNQLIGGSIATVGAATVVIPYGSGLNVAGVSLANLSDIKIAAVHPLQTNSAAGLSNEVLYWARATAAQSGPVTIMGLNVGTPGTTPGAGVNRLGIFTLGSATATSAVLAQQTADMTSAFEAGGWTEGSLSSTVTLQAGQDYIVAALTSFTGTIPSVTRLNAGASLAPFGGLYQAGFTGSQATMPGTLSLSSSTVTGSMYSVYAR